MSTTPLLELDDVSVAYPLAKRWWGTRHLKVVQNISLSLEQGQVLGLVGDSGCGKSTLCRAIAGLLPLHSGSKSLSGQSYTGTHPDSQMIFQDPAGSLNPRLTILDNITEPLQHLKKDWSRQQQRDQAYRLMQKVGLEERHLNRYPHEFSGGQCQRIGIARALAPEPKLILCDEAVSALDVSVQAQVLNCLQDLSKELQLSLLFVTHDLAVVRYLADHICVMEKGRIVERGPTESLITSPQHKATQELIAAAPSLKSFDP